MKKYLTKRWYRVLIFLGILLGYGGIVLAEVVVTGIGKKDLSSTSPITALSDEIESASWLSNDVSKLLQKTPGVYAGSTGNTTPRITLRGATLRGGDQASTLFIVDGRPVEGFPSDLDPSDISQVDVIKGSAATAIYGSRAVGGVVTIITKSPRNERTGNSFQAGYGALATSEFNPHGQALSAYYNSGGERGADAGLMFAETLKLRSNLGGPLCALDAKNEATPSRGDFQLSRGMYYPSRALAECLGQEMFATHLSYDNATGTTSSGQEMGDFMYTAFGSLGFSSDISLPIIKSNFGYDFSYSAPINSRWGWEGATFGMNPILRDNLLFDFPTRDYAIPASDNNPLSFDLAFGEPNYYRDPQETFQPNDPLYKKADTVGRKVGGVLKSGFGALLGAAGVGVGVNNSDPKSDDQWGLHDVGFTPLGTGESAWNIADGRDKNVIVAVIDSGLDINHPDAPPFIWRNEGEIPDNGIDDDTNGYVDDINGWNFFAESNDIDDDYGHGTFVTGIIAANTDNGIGIAGINPGAQIMTLKVSNKDGIARSLATYRALRYAVDNGARVINISLGRKGLSRLEQIGINYAYAMGCIVVVAAGNQGSNIAEYGPPGARRTFSVAALSVKGSRRGSSNRGLNVAIAAPGESIYSLTAKNGKRDGRIIPFIAGDYHRLNGTSFAAPIVAGTASLILAKYPYLTNSMVEDMLLSSGMDIEDPGWDDKTGMGKLDARKALSISPEKAFAPRITDWIINRDARGKIASVDIYGVVRGPIARYEIGVGKGKKPTSWTPAFGPTSQKVDHGHIARLPGSYFSKGSSWSVQLTAVSINGERRSQQVLIKKDG